MRLRELRKDLKEDKKILAVGAALLALAALFVLALMKFDAVLGAIKTLSNTVAPVFCGIVIAYILNVFVHFFEDIAFKPFQKSSSKAWKKIKRPLSVALAYLVVFSVVAFIALFIIPGLIQSMAVLGETLKETVPGYIDAAVKWITGFAQRNDLTFVQDFIKNFDWGSLFSNVTKVTTDFLGSLVNVTFNVANGVFIFAMGFIFSIYMLFGKEKLLRGVKSSILAFFSEASARKVGRIGAMANRVFFSFIRGQLTECVILGSLCYIGMSILQLDYALLISSIVALGALIPILGAYIGCITGVVILLLVHPIDALIFLIFLLCLQQVEGNLIYPRVVGSSIGLPPVWTMFAVLFWGGILGIPGILIGTPTTAVVYRLYRSTVRARLREKHIDPQDPRLTQPSPFEDAELEDDLAEQQRIDDI